MQAKRDTDSHLDKTVSNNCNEREAVMKDLLQFGVRSSVHEAEVFSNPGKTCLVQRGLVSLLDWRWICGQDGT